VSRANISFVATSSRNVPVSIPAACASVRACARARTHVDRAWCRRDTHHNSARESFYAINTLIGEQDYRKHGKAPSASRANIRASASRRSVAARDNADR